MTILAREPDPPYERPPLTKDFLRGESGREALPLVDAALVQGARDRPADRGRGGGDRPRRDRGLRPPSGEAFAFDRLLLATGADPIVPPIPGADGPAVQTVRRIGDSERLGELGRGDAALVVGSGFIGCEAAASLAMRGAEVTMATLEAAPQVERLGDEVAAEIAGWLEGARRRDPARSRAGVDPLRRRPLRPRPLRRRRRAGRRPGAAGARGRAQRRPRRRGRARRSKTGSRSARRWSPPTRACSPPATSPSPSTRPPGRRLRVEHWGEALNMGEVAGKTLAGAEAAWDVAPGFWSTIGDHTLKYVGWGDGWDELALRGRRGRRLRLLVRARRRAGRGRRPTSTTPPTNAAAS